MGHPAYLKDGKILLGTAASNDHESVHFWRGQELGFDVKGGARGELGKLTHVDELPSNLGNMIEKAAQLSLSSAPRKRKLPQKPLPDLHPEFASALDKAPNARAALDSFAPSHRREYLEWIADAKQEPTRQKGITIAIEWLGEGKRRNWKHGSC